MSCLLCGGLYVYACGFLNTALRQSPPWHKTMSPPPCPSPSSSSIHKRHPNPPQHPPILSSSNPSQRSSTKSTSQTLERRAIYVFVLAGVLAGLGIVYILHGLFSVSIAMSPRAVFVKRNDYKLTSLRLHRNLAVFIDQISTYRLSSALPFTHLDTYNRLVRYSQLGRMAVLQECLI